MGQETVRGPGGSRSLPVGKISARSLTPPHRAHHRSGRSPAAPANAPGIASRKAPVGRGIAAPLPPGTAVTITSSSSVPSPPAGYRELRQGIAWGDLGPRSAVVVSGDDAVGFVDAFCTAAISRLAPRSGSEAFFLDARGQVLLWGTVFRGADGVWIDSDPAPSGDGSAAWSLAAHLDRYHIRERLRVTEAAAGLGWLLVGGPGAGEWLERAGAAVPAAPFGHEAERTAALAEGEFPGRCAGVQAAVFRGSWGGEGSFLIVVPEGEREALVGRFLDDGITQASPEAIDAVRREDGRPSPADILPRTLAQELGRDRAAIAFDKGCYLGQETVARLDALGHVNRRLVGVHGGGVDVPRAGAQVEVEGDADAVGVVTSVGPSPRHGGWLGLALVRVTALRPGVAWRVAGEAARQVVLGAMEDR